MILWGVLIVLYFGSVWGTGQGVRKELTNSVLVSAFFFYCGIMQTKWSIVVKEWLK